MRRSQCARCSRFVSPLSGPLGLGHLCSVHQRERLVPTRAKEVDAPTRVLAALVAAETVGLEVKARDVVRLTRAPEYVVRRVMRGSA